MDAHGKDAIDEYVRTLIRFKARRLNGKYGFTKSDREDIEQDLAVFLLERRRRFDPRRGSERTFIESIVHRKVISMVRGRVAAKRHYCRTSSLNDAVLDKSGHPRERGDVLARNADWRITRDRVLLGGRDLTLDVRTTMATLDPELNRVCDLLIAGTNKEAFEEMRLSRSALRDRVLKLREIFSVAGLQEFVPGRGKHFGPQPRNN